MNLEILSTEYDVNLFTIYALMSDDRLVKTKLK